MKIVEHYCTSTTHVQEFIFTKNNRTLKLFQTGCPKTTSGGCGNKILIHKLLLKDRNDSIKRKITESS